MSSGTGIGSLMINAQQLLDMPTILCGMVLIGITGAALDKAGRLLESRATAGANRITMTASTRSLFATCVTTGNR